MIGILPVFDALVGWKACLKICMLKFFVLLLEIGRDFQVTCLLKYIASSNNTYLATISNVAYHTRIYLSSEESHISWLTKWYGIFRSDAKYYSMCKYTHKEIINLDRREYEKLYGWLKRHPKITEVSISKFVEPLLGVVTDLTESHILF